MCFRRFTEQFAKKARSVTCVDFLPSILAVNRKAHGACGNVSFIDSDITVLDQPSNRSRCALIYSNSMSAVFTALVLLYLYLYF